MQSKIWIMITLMSFSLVSWGASQEATLEQVGTCTLSDHSKSVLVDIVIGERSILFERHADQHRLGKVNVRKAIFHEGDLLTSYEGIYVTPALPLTIWFGAFGGYRSVFFNPLMKTISFDDTFEFGDGITMKHFTCENVKGDYNRLANLFPDRLESYHFSERRMEKKTLRIQGLDVEIRNIDEKRLERRWMQWIGTCQAQMVFVQPGFAGPINAIQRWNIRANGPLANLVPTCIEKNAQFIASYGDVLLTTFLSYQKSMDTTFYQNRFEMLEEFGSSLPSFESSENLLVIGNSKLQESENSSWKCALASDPTASSMRWFFRGTKDEAVVRCQDLIGQYKSAILKDAPVTSSYLHRLQ